jgi:hypothetical protein
MPYLVIMDIKRYNARFARFVKWMTRNLGIPLQSVNGSHCWRYLINKPNRKREKRRRWGKIRAIII